jgi:signal transduction histidine kinase
MSLRSPQISRILLLSILLCPFAKSATAGFRRVPSIQQAIDALHAEAESLPELMPNPAPWTLGYRLSEGQSKDKKIEIDLQFVTPATIDLIAFMPCNYRTNADDIEAFGFPERFMIERLLEDGSSEIIVDYSERDYLVSGIEPQLFPLEAPVHAAGLRMTIVQQADNPTWWHGNYITALSEIYAFSGPWNVALGAKVRAPVTSNYGYVWNHQCLTDGFSLLSPIHRNLKTPYVNFHSPYETLSLLIDLGEIRHIDELRIWPVVHSAQNHFPLSSGIGFPTQIRLELLNAADDTNGTLIYASGDHFPRPGSSPLMMRLKNNEGRYFRLSLSEPFPEFRGVSFNDLILNEIEVLEKGELVAAKFTLSREDEITDVSQLSNRLTAEGNIIPLREWLIAITRRAALDRTLATLQQDLVFAQRQERERSQFIIVSAIGIIISLVILMWLIKLLANRRWMLIRDRIACDLHDEIGANTSSLVHMTELIKETIPKPTSIQNKMLEDAIYTARLTSRETRNFVQFLESEKVSFDVNSQIRKVAQQLLADIDYSCRLEVLRPTKKLSPAEQWDLLMFIKEALNNICKHAQASHVDIHTQRNAGCIELSIDDDGKGISGSDITPRHLDIRAKRLGAQLNFESRPEQGTRIRLKLKK